VCWAPAYAVLCCGCGVLCCADQAMHESGSFNAQELSIIFWSLAKLCHTPPAPWVAGLLREGLEVAGGLQAQSLVLLLGALTRWHLPQGHTAGHYR
jgi:hypothetical protein